MTSYPDGGGAGPRFKRPRTTEGHIEEQRFYTGKKHPRTFASPWLNVFEGPSVQPSEFDIDTQPYSHLLNISVESIVLDREFGFGSLKMKASVRAPHKVMAIVIRKNNLYEVAIFDGEQLYEIGYEHYKLRHFYDASFTGFGETYQEMLRHPLFDLKLSRDIFHDAVLDVINKKGRPGEWGHSAGVFAYMISEPSRFYWVNIVLRTMMCMNITITLQGDYGWMSAIALLWGDISRWDRELKDDWEETPSTSVQPDQWTNRGLDEFEQIKKMDGKRKKLEEDKLAVNKVKRWGRDSLIHKTWNKQNNSSRRERVRRMLEERKCHKEGWRGRPGYFETDVKNKVVETADPSRSLRLKKYVYFLLQLDHKERPLLYLCMDKQDQIMKYSVCTFKDPSKLGDLHKLSGKVIGCYWDSERKLWLHGTTLKGNGNSPSRFSTYTKYVDARSKNHEE